MELYRTSLVKQRFHPPFACKIYRPPSKLFKHALSIWLP